MKDAISVAYMLARATDSVADTSLSSVEVRLAMLRGMDKVVNGLAGEKERRDCFRRLEDEIAPGQTHSGERILLEKYGECVKSMEQLPPEQIVLVRKVLRTIVEGQIWDLEFFGSCDAEECRTASPEEILKYTYCVAGCVGEFWTELAFLTLGEGWAVLPKDEMFVLGRHYGQGLQLVNILRDRGEDASRGRTYLAGDVAELVSWRKNALEWLEEGVRYASALTDGRLRFASVLPAWLGLETMGLAGILDGMDARGRKRKVGRSVVRRLMAKAFLFAWKRPRW